MKKVISIIFVCLLLLSGCIAVQDNNSEKAALFYYKPSLNQANQVVCKEYRDLKGGQSNLKVLLNAYFDGPVTENLQMLFPTGTKPVDIQQTKETVTLILSDHCANMSRLDLTIACSCLVKTLFPYTEASTIIIQAENGFSNVDGALTYREDTILTDDLIEQ